MDDIETITLYDENGEELEFEVLGVVNVDDNDYAILLPVFEEDDEQAYIFCIDIDEDGEEVLTEIEDDDEFERVKEAWQAIYEGDYDYDDIEEDEE